MTADDDEVAADFEHRVSMVVVRALLLPVTDLLRGLRRLIVFFFVVVLVVQLSLGVLVRQTNHTARESREAAKKASADLARAIAQSNSPNPVLAHAYAEIDCIAKGHVPCP